MQIKRFFYIYNFIKLIIFKNISCIRLKVMIFLFLYGNLLLSNHDMFLFKKYYFWKEYFHKKYINKKTKSWLKRYFFIIKFFYKYLFLIIFSLY